MCLETAVEQAKRPEKSRAFPGVHVFPGGMVDEADSLSSWREALSPNASPAWKSLISKWKDEDEWKRRIASIRELFEETNVLLASEQVSFSHKLLTTEEKKESRWFSNYCSYHGVEPAVSQLVPFARWIAPEGLKARFDTSFYLSSVVSSQLAHMDVNPGEIDSLDWFSPKEALSAYDSGQIKLAPPTYVKLSEMNMVVDYDALMNPPSPTMPEAILPVLIPGDAASGRPTAIVLPGDTDHPKSINSKAHRRMENPGPEQRFVESPKGQAFLSNIAQSQSNTAKL